MEIGPNCTTGTFCSSVAVVKKADCTAYDVRYSSSIEPPKTPGIALVTRPHCPLLFQTRKFRPLTVWSEKMLTNNTAREGNWTFVLTFAEGNPLSYLRRTMSGGAKARRSPSAERCQHPLAVEDGQETSEGRVPLLPTEWSPTPSETGCTQR